MFYEYGKMALPLVLYFILLIASVLCSLPAPVNVSVSSYNFHHVLHWDPGPGTPPGAQFKIIKRVNKKEKQQVSSNTTSMKLRLPRSNVKYDLTVKAFYNQTLSPPSGKCSFTPYTDTTIGPPKLTLAGCGNCIQINISLPEADRSSKIRDNDIQKFYGAQFEVFWRTNEESVESERTSNRSYTVNNLQIGTEYCVKVHTVITVNKNTEQSAWKCIFTSNVEPSRDAVVLGAATASLSFAVVVLMIFTFFLYYTGFLCKPMASVPRVLIGALSQGYILTPERKICDKISISPSMDKWRKYNNPTTSQPAIRGTDSDEAEEEEERGNIYMDRDVELSTGQSSSNGSVDLSTNSTVAASGGSMSVVEDTKFGNDVTCNGFGEDGAKPERADISLMPEEAIAGEVEEDKEEVCDSSVNINLFSVTLSALASCEEGEKEEEQSTGDSLPDFLKMSDMETLLPRDSESNSSITGSQTEADDQPAVVTPGCLKTCDDAPKHQETQEEEQSDEEFSGYLAHR